MASSINLNSLSFDSQGRPVFSGLGTGIDSKTAIDNLVKAKRLPAASLETKITNNQKQLTALKELRSTLNTLQNSIASMRGAITFGDVSNVFAMKQTSASTSRTDGLSPTAAGNLVGVTVKNSAPIGSQTLEVRRVATAHKIASGSFASTTSALSLSGSFTINNGTSPTTITVASTDSLVDIRDRINNANTGTNATKVTASIVSVSATQNILVLTNDNLGTDLNITDAGTVLSGLGLSANNGATFTNVLQRAETARLTANGLTNPKHFESSRVSDQNAQLSTFLNGATFPGSFTINGTGSAAINYTATTTLSQLKDAINLQTGTTGVTATVVQDGSGFRLDLDSATNFTLTDSTGLLSNLGVNNLQVIERSTNTISDLFGGMTVSLFGAEPGTTIKIDVDRDLSSTKTAVQNFVDAYNKVRQLINQHSLRNADGTKSADAGELFGTSIISDLRTALNTVIGGNTKGVTSDYAGLASIGITFVDNSTVSDSKDKDTLLIDTTKLDNALISNPDDIRRLFAFDLTSSDPNVVLLGFTGKTTYSATGYTLNVGTFGNLHKDSVGVTSKTALLNTASSFNATTSGSFTINGANVTYDVTTDTLESLATKINDASTTAGTGVSARVVAGSSNTFILSLNSTQNTISLSGDTGDLVAAMAVAANTSKLDSANIDGAANGAANGTTTVSGRTIEVANTSGAEGLKLFYNGSGSQSGISLNFTVGLAARLSGVLDHFVSTTEGSIKAEIDNLDGQDKLAKTRVDEIDKRLDVYRNSLTQSFIAMETAVTTMNNLLDSLKSQFTAMTNSKN